jgi:hypothetical protein
VRFLLALGEVRTYINRRRSPTPASYRPPSMTEVRDGAVTTQCAPADCVWSSLAKFTPAVPRLRAADSDYVRRCGASL